MPVIVLKLVMVVSVSQFTSDKEHVEHVELREGKR
jgi:hypothetical protein